MWHIHYGHEFMSVRKTRGAQEYSTSKIDFGRKENRK